jgi:hypothetical protein
MLMDGLCGMPNERKKAMAEAYKRLRRQRTERRLKNQSFMQPSKRPRRVRRPAPEWLRKKARASWRPSLFLHQKGQRRLPLWRELMALNRYWHKQGDDEGTHWP